MSGDAYSDRVRALFAAAAHAGPLPPGPGVERRAEAVALERGAWVELALRLDRGTVIAARYRAWGCPHLLAACELAVQRLEGGPPAVAASLSAAGLAAELGAPPHKLGRLLVLEDALHALAAAAPESQ